MDEFRDVLFWTFITFFILIGIISLLALLGIFKRVDAGFRKWAVTGFVAAVTTAVVGLFRLIFAPEIALFVTLTTPTSMQPPMQLVSGLYEYDELAKDGKVVTRNGPVAGIVFEQGGWQAKLPQQVLDKPVRLTFKDGAGSQWNVPPFYPSHIPREFTTTGSSPTSHSDHTWWPPWQVVALAAEPSLEIAASEQAKKALPKFNNYAKSAGQKYARPYYRWRVFVDEPRSVLETIQQVEYVLHATFPEPFQVSKNRESGFELVNEGWGEFTILITIRYTDGTALKTSYYLDLQKSWPEMPRPIPPPRPVPHSRR